ncbi:sterol desaturase family protein [Chitinimonas arctica]|uniref:Sterol desaturase family protein n=1 Tax=Chitinimonas arctica TaxID=2594795 RepID=A0A516SLG3_9NEIS|nr:sterol desaturase family protein [Chitinimonas arctica]QDQ28985.1 sterol desaturase family protein [Chitinimonas arctica]
MPAVLLKLLPYFYAPAMLLGFNAAALLLLGAHRSHAWLVALLLAAIAVSLFVERLIPYRRDWNGHRGEAYRDTAHAFVNEGASFAALLLLPQLTTGLPWHGPWPAGWPLAMQWLLAILIADCGVTLMHYASHRWPLLWRFHAVHHSVTRFYGFNGLLKHPVHLALETAAGMLPLILLGIPDAVAALLAFSVAVQLLLQHANVDMRIGPLRHLLALAPTHRFHHQKWAGEGDVNFGLFTTLWDRLLGSYVYEPDRRFGPGDFGIGEKPGYPAGYWGQLLAPFRKTNPSGQSGGAKQAGVNAKVGF